MEKQILVLNRWNRQKHKYEDYGVPVSWNVKCYADLEDIVNCAQCGKELKFEDCYTSLEVHTDIGMGFAVCEDCYEEEWQRRKKEDKKGVKPMNNIKILENFIDKQKSNKGTFVPTDFEIKSLENMIKEYKELKEEISKYEKQLDLDYVEENYISKSKIKGKIEEYRYLMQNPKEAEHYVAWYSRRIEILEELL